MLTETTTQSQAEPQSSQAASPEIRLDDVTRELPIHWTAEEQAALLEAFSPYLEWVQTYLDSGEDLPSHIEGSGSIAVPIGESTNPQELFEALGPGVEYELKEFDDFWITIHYPNPEPVVTLLPKSLPGTPPLLEELCRRLSDHLGVQVGGVGGWFLAFLLPGFSWAMHTDHDNAYEQTMARIQVPLITSPEALFVWGKLHPGRREEWIVEKHLEAGKMHYVRVDVPHTVINRSETEPRLHLILDVHEEYDVEKAIGRA